MKSYINTVPAAVSAFIITDREKVTLYILDIVLDSSCFQINRRYNSYLVQAC